MSASTYQGFLWIAEDQDSLFAFNVSSVFQYEIGLALVPVGTICASVYCWLQCLPMRPRPQFGLTKYVTTVVLGSQSRQPEDFQNAQRLSS